MRTIFFLLLMMFLNRPSAVTAQDADDAYSITATLINFRLSISPGQIELNIGSLPETADQTTMKNIVERVTYRTDTSVKENGNGEAMWLEMPYSKFKFARANNRFKLCILPNPFFEGCINLSGTSGSKEIDMEVFDLRGQKILSRQLILQSADTHSYLLDLLEKQMTDGNYLMTIVYDSSLTQTDLSMNHHIERKGSR
jgi:hypothetical protein